MVQRREPHCLHPQTGIRRRADSLLVNKPAHWSLYIADTIGLHATLLWKAPNTLRGSFPTTDGGANLHWAAGNTIVFLSYQDGWPHLYSIDATALNTTTAASITNGTPSPGHPLLLTPGNFMCEHIQLSADNKYLLCSANTGPDTHDLERRHVLMVSVDKPDARDHDAPVKVSNGRPYSRAMAPPWFFSVPRPQRPPLPAVLRLQDHGGNNIEILGRDLIPQDFPQSRPDNASRSHLHRSRWHHRTCRSLRTPRRARPANGHRLHPRWSATPDVAGVALFGLLFECLCLQSISRQSRVRGPGRQLPARHRLRL